MKNKVNLVFQKRGLQHLVISANIRTCINAVLKAEGVPVKCEINVLVTDDKGIQEINRTARNIDKPTDVLSFPMFELSPGQLPEDWSSYMDPDTGLVPLGDMCISLERAIAHSMLHLLGYDHLDEGPQKRQMRAREEDIAAGIPGMSRT